MQFQSLCLCVALLAATLVTQAAAETPAQTTEAAVQGHDVVAYHTQGRAVLGKPVYSMRYAGDLYQFATAAHLAKFRTSPGTYAPSFGGHCAFGVAAKGALVPANPNTFRIQDGRLLLFFHGPHEGKTIDTSKFWDPTAREMLTKADQQWAQTAGIRVRSTAIGASGHDLVSYFTQGQAVVGSPHHAVLHDGVLYRFANAAHAQAFRRAPARYLPAFGGHCAFGVAAKAAKVPSNPKTFRIQDGRLLLFFNGPFQGKNVDTSTMWDADAATLMTTAQATWPKIQSTK